MINTLKTIFPSLKTFSENDSNYPDEYVLYSTNDKQIIGIKSNEISKRDEVIISSFLSPYHVLLPAMTEQEKLWKRRIDGDIEIPENQLHPFRFVYFSVKKNQIHPASFNEAIDTLFGRPIPILWKNESSGIIIEEQANLTEEDLSYEQIIDVLVSDLYVDIHFLVGPFRNKNEALKTYFSSLHTNATTIFSYFDKPVVSYTEATLALFINQSDSEFRKKAIDLVLKETKDDKELLRTIKVFILANLNTTLAAKELYMHRNSLQYRLDKFIKKTGIDIRQFDNAALVYVILLAQTHER